LQSSAIDDAAWNASWFQDTGSEELVVCKLSGTEDGTFVIHNSVSSKTFILSYSFDGMVRNAGIQNVDAGVFLHGSRDVMFRTLSLLVDHYANSWSSEVDIYTLPCPLKVVPPFQAAEDQFNQQLLEDAGVGDDEEEEGVATMTWPTLKLKSCLRARPASFSKTSKRNGGGRLWPQKKRKQALKCNEEELLEIQRGLEPFHGIRKRIDRDAARAPYTMPDLHPGEVLDVLAAAPVGRFVINAADGSLESLQLSFVNIKGAPPRVHH
jgi:hypothetical protein